MLFIVLRLAALLHPAGVAIIIARPVVLRAITNALRFFTPILLPTSSGHQTSVVVLYCPQQQTATLFQGLGRFVIEFRGLVERAHYISPLCSRIHPIKDSSLSQIYANLAEGVLGVACGRATTWSQLLWTASKHDGQITCAAISPDGKTIVSRSGAAVGKAMTGHTKSVTCVTISPGRTTVISGSSDGTLRLWDVVSGEAVVTPDGKSIVSGSNNCTLLLWHATSGASIGEAMAGRTEEVTCVAVSSNREAVFSGSSDCAIRMWNATGGEAVDDVLTGHTRRFTCITVSPDSKTVVSESDDCAIRLWDAANGSLRKFKTGHKLKVTCLAISPDGNTVVSGPNDDTVRHWDTTSGNAVSEVLTGHAGSVTGVTISPDSKTVVSGPPYHTLRL
ncbi:hypothetical protein FRB98_000489 [Tulasnella sp. 332]|nr:hypothetical protein FRB98_000489 [Tulasnella sp. 332]